MTPHIAESTSGLVRTSVGLDVPTDRPLKASELAARRIANWIVDRAIPVGTLLSNEKEMALEFQIGRNTLREAMRMLEGWGLIEVRVGRHGGPVVRRPAPSTLSTLLTLIWKFEGATMTHVYEARELVNSAVAGLAAARIGDDALDEMREIVASMGTDVDETLYIRFNELLGRACGNPVLWIFAWALKSITDRMAKDAAAGPGPARRAAIHRNTAELVDALARRDGTLAEAVVRRGMKASYEHWLEHGHLDHPETAALPLL